MTIVQLEYIVALDTYRSFILAAKKSFVTQPTLSMQIQKLEDELGLKLFDRSKQPVVPTEAGAEILEQARVILQESYKIKELINNREKELSGELKIGIIPTIAPYLVPLVIGNFLIKYPKVKVIISELTTERITYEIKAGMLDCGILATPLDETSITETPVFYENFVAYVSKKSPIFKKKTLLPKDLDQDELWILNEGHCMRNQVLNICNNRKSNHQNFEYNTGSIETLIRMVDMNDGITILPELSVQDFQLKQLDKVRYFKSPEPAREISIVTHQNLIKKRLIKTLEEEILAAVPKRMRKKNKKELMGIG